MHAIKVKIEETSGQKVCWNTKKIKSESKKGNKKEKEKKNNNKIMATSATNPGCNKKTTVVRVGNYELHKTLGKGNFAIVKLASNIITNSKVSKLISVFRVFCDSDSVSEK